MSCLATFLDRQLPGTLRTSLLLLASITGVWLVWMMLAIVGTAMGLFVVVGGGDQAVVDSGGAGGHIRDSIVAVISSMLTFYSFLVLLAVCVINLLYLHRYGSKLATGKKALSGLLVSVTSLPFMFIAFALIMRLLSGGHN